RDPDSTARTSEPAGAPGPSSARASATSSYSLAATRRTSAIASAHQPVRRRSVVDPQFILRQPDLDRVVAAPLGIVGRVRRAQEVYHLVRRTDPAPPCRWQRLRSRKFVANAQP